LKGCTFNPLFVKARKSPRVSVVLPELLEGAEIRK
jgi:hypothetical protein